MWNLNKWGPDGLMMPFIHITVHLYKLLYVTERSCKAQKKETYQEIIVLYFHKTKNNSTWIIIDLNI